MTVSLEQKAVIVTGAGTGIGREVALAVAAAGAKVVVNDIGASLSGEGQDASPAQRVVEEIRAAGGTAVASTDSVSEWDSARRVVQCAVDNFGRVDSVVNNAGILRDRMFHKMEPEEFEAVVRVHLFGTFYISRAASEFMREQSSSSMIHMTSTAGLLGNVGQANYSAAKLGIVALSKSIAVDMARYNVRSNCIAPFAWSRMTSSMPTDTPEQQARVARLQRMEANKIAPLAVYLASDAASAVNGQIFGVRANEIYLFSQNRPIRSVHRDGGWTVESLAETAMPAMKGSFVPLERSPDVICWDPI
ncbi:SDR family NAD(P)-dependent oxidoreductase [Cupriavidus numazuensis]|uniref:Short-chain type dehydrogenase/reductase n=1 Tax=Cupriavidus numazuensis TaxID=221992 RepID=A0ABM8TV14_9BURK|nr:SDR family NAD(P)-dependent oxidoreductase [Cupriavidus numazuensis]CAG2160474.1 Putative short-chain type dehydrogenase/reductase [Cupriavidus numazuensis]